jgi:hypothetical protein
MENPYRREYHRAIVRQRTENGKNKQWQQQNPDKLRSYGKQHRNHDISNLEWELCKEYFDHSCAYCGLSEKVHKEIYKQQLHKEHVDHKGANDLSNCVPACRICNSLKHIFMLEDWYSETNERFNKDRLDKYING